MNKKYGKARLISLVMVIALGLNLVAVVSASDWQGPFDSFTPPVGYELIASGGEFSAEVQEGEVIEVSEDNDPKWLPGCVREKGHEFTENGVLNPVPVTETICPKDPPEGEWRWRQFHFSGGVISFDRNDDSGTGYLYYKPPSHIPTETRTPTPEHTPVHTPSSTPVHVPSETPMPEREHWNQDIRLGAFCDIDQDEVLSWKDVAEFPYSAHNVGAKFEGLGFKSLETGNDGFTGRIAFQTRIVTGITHPFTVDLEPGVTALSVWEVPSDLVVDPIRLGTPDNFYLEVGFPDSKTAAVLLRCESPPPEAGVIPPPSGGQPENEGESLFFVLGWGTVIAIVIVLSIRSAKR